MNVSKADSEPSLGQELRTALVRIILPYVLVLAGTVLIGLLVTKVLDTGWFHRQDAGVNDSFAENRTSTLNSLTHWGSLLGETPTIVGFTALAAAVFRLVFRRWRESVFIVLCVSGQALIFMITQLLIDRQRPDVERLDNSPPTSGFPSGHTAASTAFYCGVAIVLAWHTRHVWLKFVLGIVGALFPLTVAVSRMYRGMHYPSDVSASMLMASSLLLIIGGLYLFAQPASRTATASGRRRLTARVGT